MKKDNNDHIKEAVEYYKTIRQPGYALLITGDWGVGKTHLLHTLLPWDTKQKEAYYVSLFGLKSADEVMGELFAQINPTKAKFQKYMNQAASVLGGANFHGVPISALPILANVVLSYVKNDFDKKTPIIFDDLERSLMKENEILGIVNYFVEHAKCNVIAIAFDKKLVKKFKEGKEKIFGSTLQVMPNIPVNIEYMIDEIKNKKVSRVIAENKQGLLEITYENECKSLRILKGSIFDVVRLLEKLESKHFENKMAIQETISLVFSLSLALRRNMIEAEDLKNRSTKLLHYEIRRVNSKTEDSEKFDKFVSLQLRHKGISLDSQILTDNTLIDILARCRFEKSEIIDNIECSPLFQSVGSLEPWKQLINFDSISYESAKKAISKIEKEIEDRSIVDAGIFLHTIALLFMLSKHGEIKKDKRTILREGKKYIDDLLEAGRLMPSYLEETKNAVSDWAAFGHAYWIEEAYQQEFKKIKIYLSRAADTAARRSFLKLSEELIELMQTDSKKFSRLIARYSDESGIYSELPVFQDLAPEKFIKNWSQVFADPAALRQVKYAFERRYNSFTLSKNGPLYAELTWLKKVLAVMNKEIEAKKGLERYRLQRSIPKIEWPS